MPKRKYEKLVVPDKYKRVKEKNDETGRWVWKKRTGPFCSPESVDESAPGTSEEDTAPPVPMFPADEEQPHSIAEEKSKRSYSYKKKQRFNKWENNKADLLTVRTEMLAPSQFTCSVCSKHVLHVIRCLDCGSNAYFCRDHLKEYHRFSPLHCPEIWKGQVFLPFQLQPDEFPVLVRATHTSCSTQRNTLVSAVNVNGMSCPVWVQFCDCESESATLLRHNLWPASPQSPRVAFHLHLMDWYRALLLECRVPVKGFVDAIASKLDMFRQMNSREVTQLYRALVTDACDHFMHHCYQLDRLDHIDPTVDDGTACPACFEVERPIYSFDGNMGLVRKASSGKGSETPHHQGLYFMDQHKVDEFIGASNTCSKRDGEECSNFRAGNCSRSKSRTEKLDETGVFGAACRHEFPKLFLNLKHGERLSYPVHLLKSLQAEHPQKQLVIMYDIACLLASHMKKSHGPLTADKVKFVLPIFHSFGHKMICQLEYAPRRTPGIGLTDGETLERLWSYLRKFSTITKQMTTERRVDLLTAALLHYAERLRKNLATYLAQKQLKANATCTSNEKALKDLRKGMTEDQISQLRQAEYESCHRKQLAIESRGWKDNYSLLLFDYFREVERSQGNLDHTGGPRNLDKLCAKLILVESRHGFERWTKEGDLYKQGVEAAVLRKREQLMEKMRTLAAERRFNLAKIPDSKGQNIWKKINGNVTGLTRRLQKAVDEYNIFAAVPAPADSVLRQLVTLEQISSSQGILCASSSRVIELEDTLDRAQEELVLLSSEYKAAHNFYSDKHTKLTALKDDLRSTLQCSVEYISGCQALLTRHLWECEIRMRDLETTSASVCKDSLTIHPKPVLQILSGATQVLDGCDQVLDQITEDEKEDLLDLIQEGIDSDSDTDEELSEIDDDMVY